LWAITRVGRLSSSITLAMVKVFPEPVTPSNTWCSSPRRSPSSSLEIAPG
jgi:hypothetical protein